MADFVSQFWNWYVIVLTVASIAFCFWLVLATKGGKKEQPAEGADPETMGHVWDEDVEEFNNPLPRWWLNLFLITLIFSVVYLILYPGLGSFQGVLGWSQVNQYEQEMSDADQQYAGLYAEYGKTAIEELSNNKEAMQTGERLFASYCTTCHGSDARGAKGFPNLRDGAWLWGGEGERIKESIMVGRTGVMPAWGAPLGDDGVKNVTEYVLSLSGGDHDGDAAAAGKEKFDQLCIACHLPTGAGNPALGAPNLTDDIWLYGGSREDIVETIANGRNGQMPAHQEFLGEDRVHVLAAYVYSLSDR